MKIQNGSTCHLPTYLTCVMWGLVCSMRLVQYPKPQEYPVVPVGSAPQQKSSPAAQGFVCSAAGGLVKDLRAQRIPCRLPKISSNGGKMYTHAPMISIVFVCTFRADCITTLTSFTYAMYICHTRFQVLERH